MSKWQTIINNIDARLRAIQISGGYQTNAGDNVFEWREDDLQPAELPGIVYIDHPARKAEGAIGSFRWSLVVKIYIYAAKGKDTPAEMRTLMADVLKAIGTGTNDLWGGQAQDTELTDDSDMFIESRGRVVGEGVLILNIIYDTAKWEI